MFDPSGAARILSDLASRRGFLGAVTFSVAATLPGGSTAQTPVLGLRGEASKNGADPGPENNALRSTNPDVFLPPETDHGLTPAFWNSFSVAHRRVQDGGWSRQVNAETFPISTEMAGVNMRLTPGGVRELHWHAANEWALMLQGNCRLTAIDLDGSSYVQDVTQGDLWYFPTGIPHSLQGLGPEGCEFLLVFDEGKFSEDDTTLLSDWMIHTPPEVLAKNWGVPQSALAPLKSIPRDGRYIFQAAVPGPLDQDRAAAARNGLSAKRAFTFSMMQMPPQKQVRMGSARIVDSSNFPASANIAMAHVTLKPGGLRELHWHPNSDEWQYYIQGKGRMTLFNNRSVANTADFTAGDVGYVPKTLGHYVENTGDTDLVFLEMFKASRFQDLSLNDWLTHIPPELVTAHLGISPETLAAIPKGNLAILPIG